MQIVQFKDNPFTWSETSSDVNSGVVEFMLKDGSVPVAISNLSNPVDIYVPCDESLVDWSQATISDTHTALIELNVTKSTLTTTLMLYVVDNLAYSETTDSDNMAVQLRLFYTFQNSSLQNETFVTDTIGDHNVTQILNSMYGIVFLNTTFSLR